jgi:hypothetical protein
MPGMQYHQSTTLTHFSLTLMQTRLPALVSSDVVRPSEVLSLKFLTFIFQSKITKYVYRIEPNFK